MRLSTTPKLSLLAGCILACTSTSGSSDAGSGESQGAPTCESGDVLDGDRLITTQSELDAMEGVLEITGELRIEGFASPNLSPLSCLSKVDTLVLEDLSELAGLEGLSALREAGDLTLSNLPHLVSLTGLEELTSIERDLTLKTLPALASLEGVGKLREVGGIVFIWGATQVSSMAGMESLESAATLNVRELDALTSFSGLDALQSLDSLLVTGSPLVESLAGLGPVALNGISLRSMSGLTDMGEVRGLETMRYASIARCDKLTQINFLSDVRHLSDEGVGQLQFESNPMLVDLTGVDGVETIDGYLVLRELNLTSLQALGALREVGKSIHIERNYELGSTPMFTIPTTLEHAQTLIVQLNTSLAECQIIADAEALQAAGIIDEFAILQNDDAATCD